MKIVVIGSGNVATHLSLALKQSGNEIIQIYSRTAENARVLADKLHCQYTTNVAGLLSYADAYIFSVKDDALPSLAEETAEVLRYKENTNYIFLHTGGSVPMNIFKGLAPKFGVLYPMQTFSKSRKVDFKRVPCFVEGSDEDTTAMVKCLAENISENVSIATSEQRKRMHLAAVFACNFTNHCYRLAEKVVEEAGLDFDMFQPLIEETARKVTEMSPKNAQTGPMVRNDKVVMNTQMQLITNERTREIYRLMAESIFEESKSLKV